MSDEETRAPEEASEPQDRSDTWDEIENQLVEFGQRMADLVRSAIDDPETRRHAREVKVRLEDMAGRIGDAVDSAVTSADASGVRERAGEAAGVVVSAGKRAAGEAAPHVASALRVANETLQGLVDRLDERSSSPGAEAGEEAADATAAGEGAAAADASGSAEV